MSAYKILVADGSDTVLATIESLNRRYKLNYELIHSGNGREVCKMASALKPDIILLDLSLTEIESIRVIKILKRLKITRSIPIVVITPEISLNVIYFVGADDFIFRPFDDLKLLFRIRFALTLSENVQKIKHQNDLLIKQAEEVKRQVTLMEEQKKDIIDDITYSRRIQNAIMPSREYLNTLFSEYFLYYKPKRIVSGDFYWISSKEDKIILAVADCTGHGISGAFLTIAGTAFLNEIINYVKPNASDILNQLRHRIMRLLHQKGLEGEARDGMDIALCIFDFNDMTLQYAGANNPVYIVKPDDSIEICSPDKMPIGIHENFNRPFQNTDVKIEKNDMVYMFSDGYADQFGGPLDQKFRYKRLQNLCVDLHNKTMKEQYEGFERTMDEWIGYRDQIDDMLLIGVRI
jgi:serine phosphatase RsbU (regulator of sigma subunit)